MSEVLKHIFKPYLIWLFKQKGIWVFLIAPEGHGVKVYPSHTVGLLTFNLLQHSKLEIHERTLPSLGPFVSDTWSSWLRCFSSSWHGLKSTMKKSRVMNEVKEAQRKNLGLWCPFPTVLSLPRIKLPEEDGSFLRESVCAARPVASVMSNSLQPHRPQPTRLLCPRDSQTRILDWITIPFSRGSSRPRNWTHISCTAGRFFTFEPLGKPQEKHSYHQQNSLILYPQ